EAEPHAVALLERLAVLLAQRDHVRHVDLVERGEQGRGVLGVDEALGDRAPERAHAYALLLARTGGDRRGGGRGDRSGRLGRLALALLEVAQHVLLQQAAAGARGGHLVGREAVLGEQALGGGHHARGG